MVTLARVCALSVALTALGCAAAEDGEEEGSANAAVVESPIEPGIYDSTDGSRTSVRIVRQGKEAALVGEIHYGGDEGSTLFSLDRPITLADVGGRATGYGSKEGDLHRLTLTRSADGLRLAGEIERGFTMGPGKVSVDLRRRRPNALVGRYASASSDLSVAVTASGDDGLTLQLTRGSERTPSSKLRWKEFLNVVEVSIGTCNAVVSPDILGGVTVAPREGAFNSCGFEAVSLTKQ